VINAGIPTEWPPEVVAAVSSFQQGDLVERPPFFYVGAARFGVWQLTKDAGDPSMPDEIFELDPELGAPYGMLTTETCDLVEEDGEPRQPWVSIAPVYDATSLLDEKMLDALDRGIVGYLRRVQNDSLPPGIWVVDARIEMPFEKSWLVGREPIRTCKGEAESQELATFLAGRRDRPVLSRSIHRGLVKPLRRWVERMSARRRSLALDGFGEVRLTISGGQLAPDGVGLIVMSKVAPVSTNLTTAWDERWEDWRQRLESENVVLIANCYATYDSLSAREYRDSFHIALSLAA
jgi:hypothetical protein